MDIITGSTGTNHVTSADDRALHAGMIGLGNYVLNTGNKLSASINSSNVVRISSGDIVLNGCHARIRYGEYEDVTFNSTGSDDMKRIDLIVARYKRVGNIESVTLEVIEGTPSTNPSAPTDEYVGKSILENETISDMILYEVTIEGYAVASTKSKFSVLDYLSTTSKTAKTAKQIADEAKVLATNGLVLDSVITAPVPATDGTLTIDVPEKTAKCIPILVDQSSISDSFFVEKTILSLENDKATITTSLKNYTSEVGVLFGNINYLLLCFKKSINY
jgi:hypothetical protein